jgi:hypothetical protein
MCCTTRAHSIWDAGHDDDHSILILTTQECVICNTVYVDSIDEQGYNRLIPMQSDRQTIDPTTSEVSKKKEDVTPVVPPSQVINDQQNLYGSLNARATSNFQAFDSRLQTRTASLNTNHMYDS